ncbi:farnesyl cysteine-carboxyl methyltransferase [Coemansia sp. Benny D115]|nr:farnesyl cysteine-carboxyl methyltransferase [Coemansia sp. Benny D115]
MLEYMCVALYNPRRVDLESFMFDPDGECLYIIAMGVSTVEYVIGHWLYGSGWRTSGTLIFVGLTAALAGQAVRTLAMVTTKTSFNHIIAERREGDHKLITHGIYCYERHPSYVGFYLWAVGLQVMLRNPITGILFAGGLGYFFSKRVKFEEYTLVSLFGAEYDEYTKRTGTLIPVFGERKRPVNYMAPPPATGGRKSPIRIDGNKS